MDCGYLDRVLVRHYSRKEYNGERKAPAEMRLLKRSEGAFQTLCIVAQALWSVNLGKLKM
jgi:hypothetical protein